MFVVFLRFGEKRGEAPRLLADHVRWLEKGFAEGVFLLSGTVVPRAGGAILADGCTREELDGRLETDPFVAEGVVTAEIVEIEPSKFAPRLSTVFGAGGAS